MRKSLLLLPLLLALVPLQPAPATRKPTKYLPVGVQFGDRKHGFVLLAPMAECHSCKNRVERTTDGGKTWQPARLRRLPRMVTESRFLASWEHGTRRRLHLATIVSAKVAWGTSRQSSDGPTRLFVSSDGGLTWRSVREPCPRTLEAATPQLAARSATHAWELCLGQPGVGHQLKAVYETIDARRWLLRSATLFPRRAGRGLVSGGYGLWIAFDKSGLGVIAESRLGGMLVTRDSGRSWRLVRLPGPEPEAADASLPSPRLGFVLIRERPTRGSAVTLSRTSNAGRTWHFVRRWR